MLLLLSAAHVGEVNHMAEQACNETGLRGDSVLSGPPARPPSGVMQS